MTNFEIVNALVEKTGISYEEAKNVLEQNNYDLLDAVIALERAGRLKKEEASAQDAGDENIRGGQAHTAEDDMGREERTVRGFDRFAAALKRFWRASLNSRFIIARRERELLNVPVLVLVIALIIDLPLFMFLLIVGLFLGCRYRFEGSGEMSETANEMSEHAADFTDSIRKEFARQ